MAKETADGELTRTTTTAGFTPDTLAGKNAKLLREWIAVLQQKRGVVFDLKYQPAYSPNLNLIERLWKFLRKESLQKWHATFADMRQAVAEVLDHLDRYAQQLASLIPQVEVVVVGWAGRAEETQAGGCCGRTSRRGEGRRRRCSRSGYGAMPVPAVSPGKTHRFCIPDNKGVSLAGAADWQIRRGFSCTFPFGRF